MNYVAHTRAAHEHLSRPAQARPHHVSLYWVLFFEWNAARFPSALDLDHAATMRAARIGSRQTYRAALYDLAAWGLLSYQPSQSRHERSRCFLTDLSGPDVAPVNPARQPPGSPGKPPLSSPQVAPVKPTTRPGSGPDKTSLPGPEVGQALSPEVAPVNGLSGPEVGQASLYDKTRSVNRVVENGAGGGLKKKLEVLEGEGLSGAELIDEPAPPTDADSSLTAAPPTRAARKPPAGRGPATPPPEPRRRGRPARPEVPFAESELARYEDFAAAFAGTDYALADLRFYHAQILNWRKNGEPPRRRDWKATATQFFLNDAHDNRLKLAPGPHANDASPGTLFARTGFRSKYDT